MLVGSEVYVVEQSLVAACDTVISMCGSLSLR